MDTRNAISSLKQHNRENAPKDGQTAKTHLISLLLTADRKDGPSLIERIAQAARADRYRFAESADWQDDQFQTMTETVIAALDERPELAAESYAYLINLARWRARDARRSEKRDTKLTTYSLDANYTDDGQERHETTANELATDAVENISLSLDLKMAISQIDPTHADAFVLRHAYGMEYKDIAVKMDTTPENARQLVARARSSLRDALPNRKPAATGHKTATAAKMAAMAPELWTTAKDVKTGRVIKSVARTDNRFKKLLTFGNGQTAIVDHRNPIQYVPATPDELTTTDDHDRKTRQTDHNAPPPQSLPMGQKWTEYSYRPAYEYADLEMTGQDWRQQIDRPIRERWTNGADVDWADYQDMNGQPPPVIDPDAPKPEYTLLDWLAERFREQYISGTDLHLTA